jgi:Tol biopolymer transport system component/imidazolonepropionase-like amidohydrolase
MPIPPRARRALAPALLLPLAVAWGPALRHARVTVHEGTSMAVAVSPDGRQLAIDLQGSLWVLPVGGGTARRITDAYHDARQPSWSPDGKTLVFQGYRDGGYDLWAVDADGTRLRQLTRGPHDDREPAWAPDGRTIAFASDRGGSYDIWLLEVATGAVRRVTSDPGDDYMPGFGARSDSVAFIGTRNGMPTVLVAATATGGERRASTAPGRYDAPSWSPSGALVVHASTGAASRLEHDGRVLTGDENAFAFRAGWLPGDTLVYVADGRIRRRALAGGAARDIPFTATLEVTRPRYARARRDVDGRAPRRALGIVAPALSPDGRQVAFVALGDLWLMPVDGPGAGTPRNLTRDAALDAEPAWSPDGRHLAWSSDRGGNGTLLDLWLYDTRTGALRQLTREPTSAMGAAWSPDGTRLAFLNVDGIWRAASVAVVEVATGASTTIHPQLFGPGAPTWSADGRHVLISALQRYSARFREGTNQLLSIPAEGGAPAWHVPVPHLSIDARVGAGPVISPDGTRLAAVYEGELTVLPVAPDGTPLGPPRRVAPGTAFHPSWAGDSRTLLVQADDTLKLVDLHAGTTRAVPLRLSYAPAIPTGRTVVHAGQLWDGTASTLRRDVDVVLDGHRIARVVPHAAAHHAGARVVDAAGRTVMPGLVEFHTHLQKDFGTNAMKAYLAFGITTVRSPGSTPYEAVEDREAVDAGVRPGPRLFVTGFLMEWQRVYYKMAVAVSSPAHLERELRRARALRFDLLKSYVRMPDPQQRRIAEFAHAMGVPAASHEIYPAALSGMDNTEHTTGTSRRGYSPKAATLQRSYEDVLQLFAASGIPITPTLALGGGGLRALLQRDTGFVHDARFGLYPAWMQSTLAIGGPASAGTIDAGAGGRMVRALRQGGTLIVAGTDTPNAATLHGELLSYVLAGLTPFEALQAATVNPARQLGIDAGRIAPGMLADLIVVDGNPLEDITATTRVRTTIANGRVYHRAALLPH